MDEESILEGTTYARLTDLKRLAFLSSLDATHHGRGL